MSKRMRLFIGSPMSGPPATAVMPLIQAIQKEWANQSQTPQLRWTAMEQWHLTWQFLGETPEEKLPHLKAQLNSALAGKPAVSTHWQQLAWWPSPNRPQILVGLLENSPPLQAMAEALSGITTLKSRPNSEPDQPRQGRGQHSHRAFKPHITLARLKKRGVRDPMPAIPIMPDGLPSWQIEAVTLFQSDLHSAGAVHTPLYTVPLPLPPGE